MLLTDAATQLRRIAPVSAAFPTLGRVGTRHEALAFIHQVTPGLDTSADLDGAVSAMLDAVLPFTWGPAHTDAVAGYMNRGVSRDVAFAAVLVDELGTDWQDAYMDGRLADLYPPEAA